MEAIFGQGEFFDIKDDVLDADGTKVDVEKLKNLLKEDFSKDKIRNTTTIGWEDLASFSTDTAQKI